MTNGNNDVRELEDLLTELEGQGALPVGHYSEEDDAVTQLMDAPLGEQEWMVQITPRDRRMMSTEQLLGELATGNLVTPEMLVWRAGMSDWAPIAGIDELRVGRAVMNALPMNALPERRPLPAPPPPPTPVPPRMNGLGSSSMASPSPIGRAPLPPPPSVPFVPQPAPPGLDLAPPPAPLPVFGGAAPAPNALPELSPFSPPVSFGGSSSRGSAPGSIPAPAPASPRVNTHGPVAVDFSEMEAPRSSTTRVLMGSAIAAMLMIGGTVFALSAGGVFEASPQVSSEAKPAPAAAAAPAAAPKPAEPKPAEPKPEPPPPSAAAANEPQTQPASVKDEAPAESAKSAPADEAEKATAKGEEASDGEEASASSAPSSSKARKAGARRNRRANTEEKESAAAERAKPEPRRAPERRSKPRAAAAAPEVARAEESEEAPKTADQAGGTFNKQAAKSALDDAAAQARNCRPVGGPSGAGKVQVRYEPNGKVGAVTLLTPTFENTTTGDCVVMVFRRAAIPAFTGTPAVVMNKGFEIP